jgi:hypothetical protein
MLMMHNFAIELARFYALSGRVYENAKDLKAQQQLLIQQQSIISVYWVHLKGFIELFLLFAIFSVFMLSKLCAVLVIALKK